MAGVGLVTVSLRKSIQSIDESSAWALKLFFTPAPVCVRKIPVQGELHFGDLGIDGVVQGLQRFRTRRDRPESLVELVEAAELNHDVEIKQVRGAQTQLSARDPVMFQFPRRFQCPEVLMNRFDEIQIVRPGFQPGPDVVDIHGLHFPAWL
jgi:hypothetical protein